MREEDIKKAFSGLNPSGEQKDRIKKAIAAKNGNAPVSFKRSNAWLKRIVASAAVIALVFTAGLGVNAATGGVLMRFFAGEDVTPKEVGDEIVARISTTSLAGVEVYAPFIVELTDSRLIFGTNRGLVIYDLNKEAVITTLDLQAIDCNHFNAETKETHLLVNGDSLTVYNIENGVPAGNYYTFDLNAGAEGTITTYIPGEGSSTLNKFEERYDANLSSSFVDTFDVFDGADPLEESYVSNASYSKLSYVNDKGTSFLYVDSNNRFYIYTRDKAGNDSSTEIMLGDLALPGTYDLPIYAYMGDDLVYMAVTDYLVMVGEEKYANSETGYVTIPVPRIVSVKETEDETLVFGGFMVYSYTKVGNTLELVSGGSMPGMMRLIKDGDYYEVTGFEEAEDGRGYVESVERMCADYPGVAEDLMHRVSLGGDEDIKESIKEYLEQSGVTGIEYYKDYGWDPIKIY